MKDIFVWCEIAFWRTFFPEKENKRDKAIQNKVKKGVSFEESFFDNIP